MTLQDFLVVDPHTAVSRLFRPADRPPVLVPVLARSAVLSAGEHLSLGVKDEQHVFPRQTNDQTHGDPRK